MTDDIENRNLQQHLHQKSRRSRSRSERNDVAVHPLHRSKKHRHDRHGWRKETGEKEKSSYAPSQTVGAPLGEEDGPFFFIDRKGDPQNVVYDGNHTGVIPRYHKAGYGNLVGVDRRYRLSEDGSKASESGATYDGPRRGYAQSLLNFRDNSKVGLEQVKAERIESEDDGIKLQHEYITFGPNKSNRRKRDPALEVVQSRLDIVMGRSKGVQQDENASGDSDSDSESDTSVTDKEDLYDKFRNDIHRQHSLKLNRATLERPGDMETWLALIAYQDHIFNDRASESFSVTAKQTLAEIKLALYEKALLKITDPKSRERLTKGLMDQGAIIWDIGTLSRKWQSVVKMRSSDDLWVHYVNFRQITSMTFSYEECLSIQEEWLRRARNEADLKTRDELSIYVLLRLTTLMSQCGYTERATAVWQSLLEFTFFRPRSLDALTEQSLFQAFWESEVPRTGEPGAVGWALSKPLEGPSKSDLTPGNASSDDVYDLWAVREGEVAASSVMPARTLDKVAENDPFRVILYSDIEAYLFIPNTIAGHAQLINAFLRFGGLPALHYPGSQIHRKWWGDEFLSPCFQKGQVSLIEGTAVSDTKTLFPAEPRLSIFPAALSEDDKAKVDWQKTALKQLAATLTDDDGLAEYVVAFEASLDIKEGRKYAKSLLKSRPSNLRLYNAYALLECRLDRFESAEHVWSTAISMCQSASTVEQQDIALLWCSWIFECLRQGNPSKANMILSFIPDGRVATKPRAPETFSNATFRLRTKNYLESRLSQQLSLRQEDLVSHLTELLAILEYLASSCSISAALAVYDTTFEALPKITASSSLIEVLHQSRARLLHIHPTLSPSGYRPSEINRHLAESLCSFPDNSMFHQLYQEHTQRTGLLERIREVVPVIASSHGGQEQSSSVLPFLFAIEKEMCRPSYAGSTNHSIRAAFERGVAAAKACVRIWVWYVKWELSLHSEMEAVAPIAKPHRKKEIELPRSKVVDVYYRGIRACPWAKNLYMLAFSEAPLRKALGGTELRKVYDMMLEKGLRIHVDLDQIKK